MKSRSFPRYAEVYIPRHRQAERRDWRLVAMDIAFWVSVCTTILGLWVWIAWMLSALEIAS